MSSPACPGPICIVVSIRQGSRDHVEVTWPGTTCMDSIAMLHSLGIKYMQQRRHTLHALVISLASFMGFNDWAIPPFLFNSENFSFVLIWYDFTASEFLVYNTNKLNTIYNNGLPPLCLEFIKVSIHNFKCLSYW